MNTLHMYHWKNLDTLHHNLPIMSEGDSLVIYGSIDQDEIEALIATMSLSPSPWFLVKSTAGPIMSDREISPAQWLELILNHNNTWAWK